MIKNYIKTALRNVFRYKGFSLINILGLSLSMSVCMLIIAVIIDQYSYDTMHSNRDRMYRVQHVDSLDNISLNFASTPYALGKEIVDNYAFAEKVIILNNTFGGEGIYEDTRISFNGLYANSEFLEAFDFKLENGSPEKILDEPYSIILSKETARLFFGNENPVGKFIDFESLGSFEVKGVIEKTDRKSHIQFESLVSLSTLEIIDRKLEKPRFVDNWETAWGSFIYLLLENQANTSEIQKILNDISTDHYKNLEDHNLSFFLHEMEKIVPGPLLGNEIGFFLPKAFILFLAGLALVIIISAAFNYTSLSVARSMLRAKEVGVRKTFGATRKHVIIQFLFEAIVISLISFLFAMVLLQLLLPAFSGMQMMSLLKIRPEQNLTVYLYFLVFTLLTGILSGILPAIAISAFKPITVLKGITNIRFFSRLTLRKILLVSQFVFSIVFIISILVIFKQMNFMVNADMGFDTEVVYDINLQGKEFQKVKNEFSQLPEVTSIAAASHVPGEGNVNEINVRLNVEDEKYGFHFFSVDENYIETMGLNLLAGSNFPASMSGENEKFVIASEMAVEHFNLGSPLDAIGTRLLLDDSTEVEIIGIIKDHQHLALFLNPRPLLLRYLPHAHRHAFMRIQSSDIPASIRKFEKTWGKVDPNRKLDGDFIDGRIRYYYTFFEDVMYTVGFATILALIIAGFGLLGMATYSTRTRTREIGIRKVFGAEINGIVYLVSKSFLWMMLIAAAIGGILAFLINNLWLQQLAKRIDFNIGIILAGILIVVGSGLLIISSQTLKAARTNPANILKYE